MEDSKIPENDENSGSGEADKVEQPSASGPEPESPGSSESAEQQEGEDEKKKKKGLIRWKGVIAVVLILILTAVFNTFFIDTAVKIGFSSAASMVTSTIAGIEEASVSVKSLDVKASDFYLVDPDDVATSMVTADTFEFGLSTAPLLSKKVHISTITLEGLTWNEPRPPEAIERDKARIEKQKEEQKNEQKQEAAVQAEEAENTKEGKTEKPGSPIGPILERLSQRVTVNKDDLKSVSLMNELSTEITTSQAEHSKKLANLNMEKRLADSEKTIEKCRYIKNLKKKDLRDKKKVKQAKKDLDELDASVKDLRKLKKEISDVSGSAQKDLDRIRNKAAGLAELKKKDMENIQKQYTLDAVPEAEVANILFGESAGTMVGAYLPYVKKASKLFPQKDKKGRTDKKKPEGTVVEFAEGDELPGVLIENISFSGEKNGISITGTAQGITSNPKLYGKPMKLHVSCTKPAFTVDAVLDRTGDLPKDTYDITVNGLDPSRLLKPRGPVFPFTFKKGTLSIQAHVSRAEDLSYSIAGIITGSQLSGTASTRLSGVIKKAVEQTPEIRFELSKKPGGSISFSSNLDSALNNAVKKEIKNMIETRKKEAEEQVKKHTEQAQASFESELGKQKKGLRTLIDSKTADLNTAKKEAESIRNSFEKRKKKAENELENKLKKDAEDKLKNLLRR